MAALELPARVLGGYPVRAGCCPGPGARGVPWGVQVREAASSLLCLCTRCDLQLRLFVCNSCPPLLSTIPTCTHRGTCARADAHAVTRTPSPTPCTLHTHPYVLTRSTRVLLTQRTQTQTCMNPRPPRSFPMLSKEYCGAVMEELRAFEGTDLPKHRPNSMNNYVRCCAHPRSCVDA